MTFAHSTWYTVPPCSYFVSEIACQKNQKFGQTYVSSELVATHLCMFVLHFRTLQLTPRYKLSIYHSLWLEYTNFIQKLWDLFTQNLRFNSFWLEILNTSIWTIFWLLSKANVPFAKFWYLDKIRKFWLLCISVSWMYFLSFYQMVFPDKQENFSDKSLPYKNFTTPKGRQIPQLSGKVNNLVAAPTD